MVIQEKIKTLDEIERQERILARFRSILLYTIIIIGAALVIIPFYWMIISSMKSFDEIRSSTISFLPSDLLPFKWWKENYLKAIDAANYATLFRNTIIVGVGTVAANLVTATLAGYALARKEFVGRETIFLLLLSTMMIPGEMMTITNYITVVGTLHWLNTYQAMIIPFAVNISYIFFIRQAIRQIPNQLYQAAKVDGVSDIKFLFRIVLPIIKPTIITILILGITGAFNAYIWPNLVANAKEMQLISNGLRGAFTAVTGEPHFEQQMAASAIVTIPLLVVFILLKKYIINGVSRSGIKG
jgi:multiple sugar transport system permease protein